MHTYHPHPRLIDAHAGLRLISAHTKSFFAVCCRRTQSVRPTRSGCTGLSLGWACSLVLYGCQCQCLCLCERERERERRGAWARCQFHFSAHPPTPVIHTPSSNGSRPPKRPPTRQQIDCPHQRQQTADSRPRAHSPVCLRPSVAEALVDNGQEAAGQPPITVTHGSLSRLHGGHADQDAHRSKHFSNLSGRSLEDPRPADGGDRGDQAPLASAGTVLALQEEASMSAALSKAPMLWRRMGVDLATLQISSAALLPPQLFLLTDIRLMLRWTPSY